MTSRERVERALGHRQPDRAPLDMEARDEVWASLRSFLKVGSDEAVRRALGIDCRSVLPEYRGPAFGQGRDGAGRAVSLNEWGIGYTRVQAGDNCRYEEIAVQPLADLQSAEELDHYPWPDPGWWDYEGVARQIERLDGDYWISTGYYSIFERAWNMMGMEKFLMDLALRPELPCAVMDRILDFYIRQTAGILEGAGGRIHMVCTYDDVGTQKGMMISPDTWRRYVKPRQKRYIDTLRPYGVKVFYHSCGSIAPILEDLVEIGVDVLNPVQPQARDMDIFAFKRRFGERLSYLGGLDIQQLLPYAPMEEVLDMADRLAGEIGRDGGFILAPAHKLQPDTAPERIVSLFRHICSGIG